MDYYIEESQQANYIKINISKCMLLAEV